MDESKAIAVYLYLFKRGLLLMQLLYGYNLHRFQLRNTLRYLHCEPKKTPKCLGDACITLQLARNLFKTIQISSESVEYREVVKKTFWCVFRFTVYRFTIEITSFI